MALTSASRISAMHCLDVSFMVISEDAYISCIDAGEGIKHQQNYIFVSIPKIKNCVCCLP